MRAITELEWRNLSEVERFELVTEALKELEQLEEFRGTDKEPEIRRKKGKYEKFLMDTLDWEERVDKSVDIAEVTNTELSSGLAEFANN